MTRVRLDIDELMENLKEMKNDGYVTTEIQILEVEEDESSNELSLSAVDIENDMLVPYVSLASSEDNI